MNIDREILYHFFNRATTFDEEIKIRKWLEESEEHRQSLFRERKLFDALIIHGDRKTKMPRKLQSLSLRKIAVAITSAAAIILLTMTLTTDYLKQSLQNEAMNVIVVPQGQCVHLTLSDGTNVWLNARTRMEYPQSFAVSEQRTVTIDGEAYLDVSKNLKKPFVVQTSKGNIEVLGTKFNVTAYSALNKFETALIEGMVKVHTPTEEMILRPSDRSVLKDGKLIRRKIEDPDIYRWRDGIYCFKEQYFTDVLKQLEVYYGFRFVKQNRNISNPEISGKLRLADGIDYALRVLQKEIQFSYQRDEEKNIIYLK